MKFLKYFKLNLYKSKLYQNKIVKIILKAFSLQ